MIQKMSLGQYVPEASILHELDPRSKIIGSFLLGIMVIKAAFPLQLMILLMLLCLLMLISRAGFKIYLAALKPFALLVIITVLLQLILTPGTRDLHILFFSFGREGIIAAAALGLRLIAILLLARLLTLTTSPLSLTDGLERMMSPLKVLGFPVHELVMIMYISLRFIPLFFDEAQRIRNAQICRGADYRQGRLSRRVKNFNAILLPVLRISLQRAGDLATAMESRGYRGGEGRTRLHSLTMKGPDYLYIFLLGFITLAILLW
ncbi:MAG: energy-coupling factor transporter transmembrane protein EcfT [Syntrophomonas sp.]